MADIRDPILKMGYATFTSCTVILTLVQLRTVVRPVDALWMNISDVLGCVWYIRGILLGILSRDLFVVLSLS